MDEAQILRWAAGASIELPRFDGVSDERILYLLGLDEERLFDLLREHRLAHRFVFRARQERPGWCSRRLLAGVANLCTQVESRVRSQMAAVREISAALGSRGLPVIAVKGYATYALTGQPHTLRFSTDLDLFYEDSEELWQALRRLSYTGERLDRHEVAIMHRRGVTIEIHEQFPVLSYPEAILAADLAPARHPGCWRQPPSTRDPGDHLPALHQTRREIHYEDLLAHAVHGVTPETRDLAVPDPTMCLLILCAHEFRDYIEPPFRRLLPVRLGALADIAELIRHPGFDPDRFLSLVERFEGHDTVRFVGHALDLLFGSNPLPERRSGVQAFGRSGVRVLTTETRRHGGGPLRGAPDRSRSILRRPSKADALRVSVSPWFDVRGPERRFWFGLPFRRAPAAVEPWPAFPRALSYHGCWASLSMPEDLLFPLEFRTLVDRLGANTLAAGADGEAPLYLTRDDGNGHRIERLIIETARGAGIPFALAVTWGREALEFEVRLPEPLEEGQKYQVRVRAAAFETIHHWAEIGPDATLLAEGAEAGEGSAEVAPCETGCACRFRFPWVALPRYLRVRESLPVLLHLMRYLPSQPPDAREIDPVVVVPLRIVRPAPSAAPRPDEPPATIDHQLSSIDHRPLTIAR